MKRLFLFAGYDPHGVIGDCLLHYLGALSKYGDIIFVMDNEATDTEINKLKNIKNILYKSMQRHGEYDFGSYKRAYKWAYEHKLLKKYDWVYLVNDSVYGPLFDIKRILEDLESREVDLTGMIDFTNQYTPRQVQSWFVGLSQRLINEPFLKDFMDKIKSQTDKQLVVLKYEVGLSEIILLHGYKMSTFISGEVGIPKHRVYDEPLEMLKKGLPFVKKRSLENMLGMQYLYPYTTELFVDQIYRDAVRTGINVAAMHNAKPKYEKSYRLTFWGFPLVTIYRQCHDDKSLTCYKIYLMDFVPVFKISSRK